MKKLVLLLMFALLASACGGSDDADVATDSDPVSNAADTDDQSNSTDSDADDEDDDGDEDSDDGQTLTTDAEPAQVRDCAHSLEELGVEDDAEEDIEVELPPAEKPDVDDEFLTSVDELITTDLIVGTGREAIPGATVGMQYVGVLASDGTEFDASWNRGAEPFVFTLGSGQVIPGWDEGIAGMKVGGRRVLQIPFGMAYGEQGSPPVIGPSADLVFIVDLIDISGEAVASPPVDADNLGSFGELQIIDLVEGEGCTAEIGDIVAVNYVGVDAVTGVEFDSSWSRGAPFDLIVGRSQVIDGWNEGITGMKVGGERILQIPAGLAYNEGDLVFRVHLEELIEAPEAHQITFDGRPPSDAEVTTLSEGTGDGAEPGDIVDTNILVMLHNSNVIAQSSWQQGSTTQLALTDGALLPGLEEGLRGIKVGELRQIILPPSVAYPDGVPANAGLEADDALVFIVEPVSISDFE